MANLIQKSAAIRTTVQPENKELPEKYPDDYRGFFAAYYTPAETKKSVIDIPLSDSHLEFELKLERRKDAELTLQQLYQAARLQ